jgi:aspartyl-tRNA(Asn)/glutamyl-tRNA(Gln) amidotransferase subunit C
MTIDINQVRKVALLARLDIPNQQEEQFAKQLNSILDYFEQLSELDTESVPPTTRAIELSNVTRADQQENCTLREEILGQAPSREGDFFRVPNILASADPA